MGGLGRGQGLGAAAWMSAATGLGAQPEWMASTWKPRTTCCEQLGKCGRQ
uniref:Uncharacterized protein n=1 Tax=Arundo donax TaxID=35708 RepID=A0A0A9AJ75_ARUDO